MINLCFSSLDFPCNVFKPSKASLLAIPVSSYLTEPNVVLASSSNF
nr:MAG TPA: hypothetical protein [Bacteriophage sp.]